MIAKRLLYWSTAAIVVLAFSSVLCAQSDTAMKSALPEISIANLKALDNDVLVQQRDERRQEISDLETRVSYLRDIQSYQVQLGRAVNSDEKTKFQNQILDTERWAGLTAGQGTDSSKVTELVRQYEADKVNRTKQLKAIDAEIGRRLAGNTFRTYMSGIFAAIVAIVIMGFFLTASRSKDVIEKIFGGQEGLQFITLFSLVIAIILFGITGVLEGKELSALLGGLAGYILGRSSGGSAGESRVRGGAEQPRAAVVVPESKVLAENPPMQGTVPAPPSHNGSHGQENNVEEPVGSAT